MPTYHIEEMENGEVVRAHLAKGATAVEALKHVVDRPVSPGARQPRWFRVVDESQRIIHEFSFD